VRVAVYGVCNKGGTTVAFLLRYLFVCACVLVCVLRVLQRVLSHAMPCVWQYVLQRALQHVLQCVVQRALHCVYRLDFHSDTSQMYFWRQ